MVSDEKPKPGRPKKWSSDAERMRAHRAAKREKPRADGERRAAAERDAAEKAKAAWSPAPSPEAPATNLTAEERSAIYGPSEAIVEQLREVVERLEAEYDEVVDDRWIVATQYRLAIYRMQSGHVPRPAVVDRKVRDGLVPSTHPSDSPGPVEQFGGTGSRDLSRCRHARTL